MSTVSVDHAGQQGGCCVLLRASVPSVDDHACVHHSHHTAFHLTCLPNVQRATPAVLLGRVLVSCTGEMNGEVELCNNERFSSSVSLKTKMVLVLVVLVMGG